MHHDLNFWSEPNWRRESTINPVFLMVIIFGLFAVAGFAVTTVVLSGRGAVKEQLAELQAQNAEIEQKAEVLRRYQTRMKTWQEYIALLEHLRAQRVLWSRQLEALQALVPETMTLRTLNLKGDRLTVELEEDEPPPKGKKKEPKTQMQMRYVLNISGIAEGARAQEIITEFSRQLSRDPVISRRLQSRELKNISGNVSREGKSVHTFTIVCTYEPVPISGS